MQAIAKAIEPAVKVLQLRIVEAAPSAIVFMPAP